MKRKGVNLSKPADPFVSLHPWLIKGFTYLSFGTKPGEKPLEYIPTLVSATIPSVPVSIHLYIHTPSLLARLETIWALRMIHANVFTGGDPGNPQAHLEEENIHRLFSFYWQGRATWGSRGRRDAGKQPDREALRTCLLYMQDTINAYAAEVPAVTHIPTYIHAPQYDLADSQNSLNMPNEDLFIDSLQRYAVVEDD
jgi:hypothetical protein